MRPEDQPTRSRDETTTQAGRTEQMADFAELTKQIREEGLLERQLGYYALKFSTTAAMLGASIWTLLSVDILWVQLANAAFLAFVFGQIGYIAHDAGHMAICQGARGNRIIGHITGSFIAVSQAWWIGQHNQHHQAPNDLDSDPHTMIPVLAFSEERARELRGITRRITAWQAFYFLPITTLEGMSMRLQSVRLLISKERPSTYVTEAICLSAHAALYIGLLLYALGPWQALAFAAIHQGLFGVYYGVIFAPNHKGMLILDRDNPMDFVRTQVLTTRNVRPNPLVDFMYGGLNYQIEHHLFTKMPRNKFGQARPIIREFCQERGISYHEAGVIASYREILGYMHQVTRALRKPAPTSAPAKSAPL